MADHYSAPDNQNAPWPTGFMVIQGNLLEDLRHVMVDWCRRFPLGPLEDEQILVQSNGIAQWLKLALAEPVSDGEALEDSNALHGFGIAAAINTTLPGRFVWQAYSSFLPELPAGSPFDKAALSWRLYRLLRKPGFLEQASFTPLKNYLAESAQQQTEQDKRVYHLSALLADLYDQYQVYRADWLNLWQGGQDVITSAKGETVELRPEQQWQAGLWRAIVADVKAESDQQDNPDTATTELTGNRSAVHQRFLQAAKACPPEQRPYGLPRRVIIFGITSLPQQTLEVLKAISHLCQVMLFVSNPCQYYWGDIIEGRDLLRHEYKRHKRNKQNLSGDQTISAAVNYDQDSLHQYGHPLLASWGKQGRDYLHLLDEQDEKEAYENYFDGRIDLFRTPINDQATHLLAQLQDDILQLNTLQDRREKQAVFDPESDDSIRFAIAHSPQREVEILHDQLLAEFEKSRQQGNNLQPRDILVMVPDIHVYAPHIEAVFGRYMYRFSGLSSSDSGNPHDPRFMPYHISDQGQRSRNTLLIAFEKLTRIEHSRFTVNDLRELLEVPAVMTRMGLTEDDLERLQFWIEGAQIRWGLNAQQKTDFQLPPDQPQNTWQAGLKRMLLGFASGPYAGHWQEIEPYSETGGLEAALVGPLVSLMDRLETWWQEQKQSRNAAQWAERLHQLTEDFFTATGNTDQWALEQIEQASDALVQHVQDAGLEDDTLPLAIFAPTLLEQIDQPTLTQKFLGGSVNFATLMPMRAVPFRQIWLLGMNDGDYPRSHHAADFDLMAEQYRPGDRSRREDDRYLLLEALLSARDKLVISWVGRSIRDNNEMPPSVLVGQLRDHLSAGWRLKGQQSELLYPSQQERTALLDALTTEYPMQPFSPDYFKPGRDPRLFTYGVEWRAIHETDSAHKTCSVQTQSAVTPESAQALPEWYPDNALSLKQLTDFLKHPVDAFFAQRLQVFPPEQLTPAPDTETYEFDGLSNWQLKDQLIATVFRPGLDEAAFEAEMAAFVEKKQREGVLIQGNLGRYHAAEHFEQMPTLYQEWNNLRHHFSLHLDNLPAFSMQSERSTEQRPYWMLEHQLTEIYQNADGHLAQICLSTSSLRNKKIPRWSNYIQPWLKHLIACAQLGEVETQVVSPAGKATFAPIEQQKARTLLTQQADLWWQGMQHPLPFALNTGFSWLKHASAVPTEDMSMLEIAELSVIREAFDKDLAYSSYMTREYPTPEVMLATQFTSQDCILNFTDCCRLAYGPLFEQGA
ncbi:exodeoxyribonuclease V subunit gamma [Oceanospirillum sediminis]|uniref:RecBCD enzyme subunit RecC n=1 Tax=Oceanospirillum sediminis TaxID=2760088 RepID=A0A839IU69_9GAMM|nr:exodeoxyribonuclease V subunit gamma [Oceanospirillum sediminis]MBB1488184.1 exodeoxyribonuclease V subunit gamma [Oceanospirillum sediminis]